MTAYATTIDMWSPKHRLEGCRICGRSDRKHFGDGRCAICYKRDYRREGRVWAERGTFWSNKHRLTACRDCETSRFPHRADGFCTSCWGKQTANKEKRRASTTPEHTRRALLKTKYGLTPEQFDDLEEAQHGVCAVCGDPPSDRYRRLEIDHDHQTGEIRGLLCGHCNKGIGLFKDDPDRLAKAIGYLRIAKDLPV